MGARRGMVCKLLSTDLHVPGRSTKKKNKKMKTRFCRFPYQHISDGPGHSSDAEVIKYENKVVWLRTSQIRTTSIKGTKEFPQSVLSLELRLYM